MSCIYFWGVHQLGLRKYENFARWIFFFNRAVPLKVSECIYYLLCSLGILAEQYAANGPAFHLYNSVEKQWDDLMNWQHSTMYLFFGLMGAVSLVVHTTDAAPLALDRLMLALAFFTEGEIAHSASSPGGSTMMLFPCTRTALFSMEYLAVTGYSIQIYHKFQSILGWNKFDFKFDF